MNNRPRIQSAHLPNFIVDELSICAEGHKVTPSSESPASRNRSRSAYLDSSVESHASRASGTDSTRNRSRKDRPVSARPPSSHFLRGAVQRPSTTDPSTQVRAKSVSSKGHQEWGKGLAEWSINSDQPKDQNPLQSPCKERLHSAPRQRHPAVPLLNIEGKSPKHANGYLSPEVLEEYRDKLADKSEEATQDKETSTWRSEEEDGMADEEDTYRWYRKSGWRSQRVKKFQSPLDSRDFLKPRHRATGSIHALLAATEAPASPKETAPKTWLFSRSDARSQPLVRYRSKIWTSRPASAVQMFHTATGQTHTDPSDHSQAGDERASESERGAQPLQLQVFTRGGGGGGWWRSISRHKAASDHGLGCPTLSFLPAPLAPSPPPTFPPTSPSPSLALPHSLPQTPGS